MYDYVEDKKPVPPDFDVALVDVDSMIYSVSWVQANKRQREKMLLATVEKIADDLEVKDTYAFIKGKDNFRHNVDIEYKANRKSYMEPEMLDRVAELYDYAREVFISSDGGEADDYCSIYSYQALDEGKIPIVVHIDKDLIMIPGWHYNPKTMDMYFVSPQDAYVFMMRQMLTGDSSDNIPGCHGVGPTTASKILQNKFLHQMKDVVLTKWRENYTTGPGKIKNIRDWKDRFLKSANCLLLRESLDDLREFNEEEILQKISWTATKERYMLGITENEGILRNAIGHTPIGEMYQIGYIVKYKDDYECESMDTGSSSSSSLENSNQSITTDSSTESPSFSQERNTSGRKPSTSTRKVSESKKVAGKNTQVAAKKLTSSLKNMAKSASNSK